MRKSQAKRSTRYFPHSPVFKKLLLSSAKQINKNPLKKEGFLYTDNLFRNSEWHFKLSCKRFHVHLQFQIISSEWAIFYVFEQIGLRSCVVSLFKIGSCLNGSEAGRFIYIPSYILCRVFSCHFFWIDKRKVFGSFENDKGFAVLLLIEIQIA